MDIEQLIGELRSTDYERQIHAAAELGRMGGPRAVEALIQMVGDVESKAREYAAEALGELKSSVAVDALIQAASDPTAHWHVPEYAARALGEIGDPRAGDLLLTLEAGGNADVSQSARFAIVKLGDKRIIPRLVADLSKSDEWGRYEAALLLGDIGDESALSALELIKETHVRVRRDIDVQSTARESLCQIRNRLALPPNPAPQPTAASGRG